jgi:hypothetical protein
MNGTSDYKFGQIEQKVEDMCTDVTEWKTANQSQHNQIMVELREIRKELRLVWGDVGILKVKAGWISALVSAIVAATAIVIKTFI